MFALALGESRPVWIQSGKKCFLYFENVQILSRFFRNDSKKVHEIHSKLYQGDQFNRNIFPAFLTNKRPQGTMTTEYLI